MGNEMLSTAVLLWCPPLFCVVSVTATMALIAVMGSSVFNKPASRDGDQL